MTIFEKLKAEHKTISKKQLKENKKSNVFYCNFQGGLLESKENIELIAKALNLKVTYDYVRMLAELKNKQ